MFSKRKILIILISAILFSMLLFTGGCEKSPKEEADISGLLIISPVNISESADKMDDAALVSLLEKLYKNAALPANWIWGMWDQNIVVSIDNVLLDESGNPKCYLVENIPNIEALKVNLEAIYSDKLLANIIYPMMISGNPSFFIEEDGKLYINPYATGVLYAAPDFTRANVIKKSSDTFEIEVPMTQIDDAEGKIFVYKAVQQKGNWVLDNFFYFQ